MTPQELKASILQLAIQGKLVEQRPEEGTGEELYRQIQSEKQRLIKSGKIKKEKPIPEISLDEIPFEIPENWKWVRLGNVLREVIVPMRDKPPFSKSGIPWCRIEDRDGFLLNGSKSSQFVSDVTIQEMNLKVLPVGTVLSACTGGSIGTIVINTVECCTNQTFNGLLCSSGLYNWYLFWFLTTKFNELRKVGTGTTIAYVSQNKSKMMVIPLPPLTEQKRIVAKIEELLPYIDRYEKAWSKLEDFNKRFPGDMQKSLLQMAIQGKLVDQRAEEGTGEELYRQIQSEKQRLIKSGKIKKEKPLPEITPDEIPFDIPESWKWVRFGDLGNFKKGPFGSAITKSMFIPKGNRAIKVYEQKNAIHKDATLGDYYISRDYFEAKMKGFELCPGDIIVSCAGTIGETYVMPDKFEQGIINQALMRMRIFKPIVIPYFLMFFDFMLKRNARSSSKGSAIKNIPPFEIMKNYLVPIPPLAEQKRIVAKLEELLPLCERLK